MARLDNSTLPDNEELSHILAKEVTRDLPSENYNLHFPDFSLFRQLLTHFNLPTIIIDSDHLDIHQVVSEGTSLLDTLVPKILHSNDDSATPLLDTMYDYLSEEDAPKKSELLFVFGSRTNVRADKAAEIYHQGLADTIIVSGGNPIYHFGTSETEADRYKDILINSGIAEEHIILENSSITMPDNVRRSLGLLEQTGSIPGSIIVVNSPYAQRRGWSILKKHLPQTTTLYRVNSTCAEEYRKENWYKQEKTLRIILNEFIKMRASVVYNTA